MQTGVFEIEFKDGRTFRVFCANRTQTKKVLREYKKIEHLCHGIKTLTKGIHTAKQWYKIVSDIENEGSTIVDEKFITKAEKELNNLYFGDDYNLTYYSDLREIKGINGTRKIKLFGKTILYHQVSLAHQGQKVQVFWKILN